jgi:DNA adenine methylase
MQIPRRAKLAPQSDPARRRAPKRPQRSGVKQPPAPILKWAGGKTKLLGELTARTPGRYGRYFEPFVGGGALFFRLAPRGAVLGDRNRDLVNVYRCVAWQLEKVARRLAKHRRNHDESYYYEMRERFNEPATREQDCDRAALFLYLNKTCYNGLYRVNRKGHFNVPVGRYDNPTIYDLQALRAASALLQKAELYEGHYSEVVKTARKGDLVYFDPPYHPLTKTANFTSYTADSFDEDDQAELADVASRLARKGCHVMLSNSDTPFIRKLYKGWQIDRVDCPRAINSKASARGVVHEIIATTPM